MIDVPHELSVERFILLVRFLNLELNLQVLIRTGELLQSREVDEMEFLSCKVLHTVLGRGSDFHFLRIRSIETFHTSQKLLHNTCLKINSYNSLLNF